MAQDQKKLLIVDDMEIDRVILKSILAADFELVEADNGNAAFEYLTTIGDQLSGILLDISMPHINGFDVLRFMQDKNLNNIPVFLMTAEPTMENVQKALQYNVAEFLGKPFDREDVLRRLRSKLGVVPVYDLGKEDLKITTAYIADLEALYQKYLANFGRDDAHYVDMRQLTHILLTAYSRTMRDVKLTGPAIDLISQASYFCDIGMMLIPDKRLQLLAGNSQSNLQYSHPSLGASLIRLNRSKNCDYFVEVCSSMCLHHHERYDGTGYPDGLAGDNISLFNQVCRLADEFEQMRSKFYGDKTKPIRYVIRRLTDDNAGMVDPKLYYLLEDCEPQIMDYFMKKDT